MDIPTSFSIITLAALVHASFQLSVSVLTLLSGHAIGSKKSHNNVLKLTASFLAGSALMIVLLLSFSALVFDRLFDGKASELAWITACGLLIGVAVAIWLFYYRREKGTILWIPRGMARYLTKRTKSTKMNAEAFGLGLTSVTGEILFLVAPLVISALTLIQLPASWQLAGLILYTAVSMLSLFVVWVLVGSGHTLSSIQKWRENNKGFLQFSAGAGLLILVFFVYVNEIIGNTTVGGF